MKHLLFAMSFLLISLNLMAQQDYILEKDYEISRKAKKGYLGDVQLNTNQQIELTYFLPSSKRKVKIETYVFDNECNLVNSIKEEWDVERVKKKFKGFKFKGETYSTQMASLSANMMNKTMFKKREIQAVWNWWRGDYVKRVKLLDRQKLMDPDSGEPFYYVAAHEVERDSAILALVYPADNTFSNLNLLKVKGDGSFDKLKIIPSPASYNALYAAPLQDAMSIDVDNDALPRDWIVVLAPNKTKKTGTPNNQFMYLRISPEGNLKEQQTLNVPYAGYRILNAYEENGKVIFYGSAMEKDKPAMDLLGATVSSTSMDDEELSAQKENSGGMLGGFKKMAGQLTGKEDMAPTQASLDAALDEKNYSHFVIGTLTNGNASFLPTSMDDINAKMIKGLDMKNAPKFNGKKFITTHFQVLKNGDMMLALQDFKNVDGSGGGGNKLLGALTGVSTSRSGGGYDRVYKEVFLLHFNSQGNLIADYAVEIDQKNKRNFLNTSPMAANNFPAYSSFFESADGKSIKWVMEIVKAIDKDTSFSSDTNLFTGTTTNTTSTTYKRFYSIEYGEIDLANKKSSEFKTLGDDEKRKFYLYEKYNRIQLGDNVYFFSETPNGDKLLVSRLNISH